MTIIFYDINLLNLKKYIGDILCNLIENKNIKVILLYDEFSLEGYNFFSSKDCIIKRNRAFTYSAISKFFNKIHPDLFMVNAQRLSDTAFVSVAKKQGIKTGMIQHGMYIPFLKRERFFFIKKLLKTIKYFIYSQVIAKAIGRNGITVFKQFFTTFVKGKIYKDAVDFTKLINTDFVLVYGEYWKHYHHDIFGYSIDSQHTVGYHELNKIDSILSLPYEQNAICYIAQTLVEDGRIEKKIMDSFLKSLSESAGPKKIYIKLHPRSDTSMYDYHNFILSRETINNCGFYVGHYSSLIALCACLNGKVILYEFPGHDIPAYFSEIAVTVDNINDLKNELQSNKHANGHNINYYFAKGYKTDTVVALLQNEIVQNKQL